MSEIQIAIMVSMWLPLVALGMDKIADFLWRFHLAGITRLHAFEARSATNQTTETPWTIAKVPPIQQGWNHAAHMNDIRSLPTT